MKKIKHIISRNKWLQWALSFIAAGIILAILLLLPIHVELQSSHNREQAEINYLSKENLRLNFVISEKSEYIRKLKSWEEVKETGDPHKIHSKIMNDKRERLNANRRSK
jgi:hypothetical protein